MNTAPPPPPPRKKRPYSTPTLAIYGTVRAITEAQGNGLFEDGLGPTKTS